LWRFYFTLPGNGESRPATAMTNAVCSGVGFTSTPVDVTNGVVPAGTTYTWTTPSVIIWRFDRWSNLKWFAHNEHYPIQMRSAQTATYIVTPTREASPPYINSNRNPNHLYQSK
jgi:hypothetical protein